MKKYQPVFETSGEALSRFLHMYPSYGRYSTGDPPRSPQDIEWMHSQLEPQLTRVKCSASRRVRVSDGGLGAVIFLDCARGSKLEKASDSAHPKQRHLTTSGLEWEDGTWP